MPSTAERIRAAADERAALSRTIAASQHAAPTLALLSCQITALANQDFDASQLSATMALIAREKQAALDKARGGGSLSRLFHKDKHEAHLRALEDDAVDAQARADRAAAQRALLAAELTARKGERDGLRALAANHTAATMALEALYSSVFDGPSADTAEEDALEQAVRSAQAAYDRAQARVSRAAAVVNTLSTAQMRVAYALNCAGDAVRASRADVLNARPHGLHGIAYNGGPSTSARNDHRERQNLAWVHRSMAEAERYVALAAQMEAESGNGMDIGEHDDPAYVRPALADPGGTAALLDRFVDNPLTDSLFHMQLEDTQRNVADCAARLARAVTRADDRRAAIETTERATAEAVLAEGRQRLLEYRRELFERALNQQAGLPEEEPPAYDAVEG